MPVDDRQIRVFVSSTFRDMQEDRDYLVKHIFPQLRKLCESRGVIWGEVDLRWGITDEEAAEGKVLPLCLEEIHRCRPYFIGLLGERYGWVPKPEDIPQDLLDRQEWLKEHQQCSVTELEIIHGVLREEAMHGHAYFYFRDPGYLQQIPAGRDQADFQCESAEAEEKLASLKQRIRAGRDEAVCQVREPYHDREELGEWILEDFTALIDNRYPEDEQPSALEREAALHEAFARSRTGVYIGKQEYFDRLDAYVDNPSDGQGLVVLGESGSGKSALLANWIQRRCESHPNQHLIAHFIGATADSVNWQLMLRRIMGELKAEFDIPDEIPDDADALRSAFANWLHIVSAQCASSPLVLVIDALNQLEDREGALDLVWLPPVVPDNVRLVLSTLPGRPLEVIQKRNWLSLAIKPLDDAERRTLIHDCLAQYTKSLNAEQTDRIANAPQTANPLYLRALLEELRVFGSHELLNERIDGYLQAPTIRDLYYKIICRWEQDYGGDTDLVGDALSLIWASRRGLSETELLELLGDADQSLPRAEWSPLYLAAEASLINRGGLIGFFHDYLREAVQDAYLPTPDHEQRAHLRLADYFAGCEPGPRRIDELPWQLAEAAAWQRLYDLLADLEFFETAWDFDQYEVKAYWARLEADSPLRMVEAYRPVLDASGEYRGVMWLLATLLQDTGHPREAEQLRTYFVEHFRNTGDRNSLSACLGNQAVILADRGELDEAMRLHQQQEQICRELGNKDGLQACLGNQALILKARGELDEAMRLHQQQEQICRELGNKDGLQACLGNQALILADRGELDEAMRLHKEKEQICRELGNKDSLQRSLGNQALILADRGELDEAMRLHQQEEQICRELGNKDGLQRSLGHQAVILANRGELDEAMRLLKQQEQICRELGNKDGLQTSLGNQALILRARGELDEAMRLLKQQEQICRELGNKDSLQRSLGNQAVILADRGELDETMRLHKQQEQICRELGKQDGLQACLGNQALILRARGELDEAMRLHKQQEQICRELGNKDGLANTFAGQALILKARGELDEAMRLHQQQEQICRELGNKVGLSTSLNNQALILADRGELDEAMRLHQQEEQICRELGNKDGLQASLGNQANIHYARGELDEAMRLHQQQEQICRELGNKDGLQISLGNQANIHYARGELDKAMRLHKENEQICRELGNKDSLSTSLGNQAVILIARGELDEAMRLLKQQEQICRELGNKDGLARSLINQAALLAKERHDPVQALPLAEEAFRLATDHGLHALAGRIEPILNRIRQMVRES